MTPSSISERKDTIVVRYFSTTMLAFVCGRKRDNNHKYESDLQNPIAVRGASPAAIVLVDFVDTFHGMLQDSFPANTSALLPIERKDKNREFGQSR